MNTSNDAPQYLTIRQFVEKQPAFTTGGVRAIVFYCEDAAEKAGAIARLGRRILIDEPRFLAWVRDGGAREISGDAKRKLKSVKNQSEAK